MASAAKRCCAVVGGRVAWPRVESPGGLVARGKHITRAHDRRFVVADRGPFSVGSWNRGSNDLFAVIESQTDHAVPSTNGCSAHQVACVHREALKNFGRSPSCELNIGTHGGRGEL